MTGRLLDTGLKVFATCPPSFTASPQTYLREVSEVARLEHIGVVCERAAERVTS